MDPDIDRIIAVASDTFLIKRDLIVSRSNEAHIVQVKHALCFVLYHRGHSVRVIGKVLGYKDHSVVIYGRKMAQKRMLENERYRKRVDRLTSVHRLRPLPATEVSEKQSDEYSSDDWRNENNW